MIRTAVAFGLVVSLAAGCGSDTVGRDSGANQGITNETGINVDVISVEVEPGRTIPCVLTSEYANGVGVGIDCDWR